MERLDSTYDTLEGCADRTRQLSPNLTVIGCASRPAPIFSLPSEIIHGVFQLIVKNSLCIEKGNPNLQVWMTVNPFNRSIKYPELLSHVCSLWRQTIISSPRYWTHIDIFPFHEFSEAILNRAITFATRACHLPLEIHMFNIVLPFRNNITQFSDFLSLCMPQASSLTIITRRVYYASYSSIIGGCFQNAIPGKLLRLSASEVILEGDLTSYAFDYTFLESAENRLDANSLGLDVPSAMLEDHWRSITVLQTNTLCPHWSSQAYSGLVDLRLICAVEISKHELASVLASSPGLRILQLVINIPWSAGEQYHEPRVRLEQLEVLDLGGIWSSELEAVLSVLHPGSKPLQFVVQPPDPSETRRSHLQALLKEFLASSNVTMLYMIGLRSCWWLDELPHLVPRLDTLIINRSYPGIRPSLAATSSPTGQVLRLEELYITHTYVDLDDIFHILRIYSVNRLTLGGTRVYQTGSKPLDSVELQGHLSHLCSSLWLLDEEDVPIEAEIDNFSLLLPV